MTYSFDNPALTQTFDAKDLVSQNYGNKDGYTFCGTRSYAISNPDSVPPYVTLENDMLTVHTTDISQNLNRKIEVTIAVTLANYSEVPGQQATLNIEMIAALDPCIVDTCSEIQQEEKQDRLSREVPSSPLAVDLGGTVDLGSENDNVVIIIAIAVTTFVLVCCCIVFLVLFIRKRKQ